MSYNHSGTTEKRVFRPLRRTPQLASHQPHHFDHSDSRHPRVRLLPARHLQQIILDGNAKYGSGSTMGSHFFVEGNGFRNC